MIKLFWQQIPNTFVSRIIKEYGHNFDGVVLDMEHGVWNLESMCNCLHTLGSSFLFNAVRIKEDSMIAQAAYDNGANVIIVSNVTKDIDIDIGIGLNYRNGWGIRDPKKIKYRTVAQIESIAGIDYVCNNELKYDFYMIGPYDLSNDLGCCGDFENKDYTDAISRFKSIVPPEKRGIHLVKDVDKQFNSYKDYCIMALSMDTLMIAESVKNLTERY